MPRALTDAERFQRAYRRKPARNEFCLQKSVVKWCNGVGSGFVRGRFFASANGGSLRGGAIAWKRLADTGAKAGVPDLCFFRRDGRVLFVELKNGSSGVLSPAQKEWARMLEENRIAFALCRTLAEAVAAVTHFYLPLRDERNPTP
jgi:hypothetical protein